jgi:hypothetical protein
MPGWRQLVELLAKHAGHYSAAREQAIREQMRTDLIAAIDLYEIGDAVPPVERAKFLRDQFDVRPDQVTEAANALARLPAQAFLTTNFDPILSHAMRSLGLEVFSNASEELQSALSVLGTKRFMVHLHGRASVYESMALGSASYERITRRPAYEQLLRDVFLRYCVLAVGFSFSDPPFQRLLQYVTNDLSSAGSIPHVAVLPHSSQADRALLKRANFELIEYDDTAGHKAAVDLLHRLTEQSERHSRPATMDRRLPPTVSADVTLELARIYATLTAKHRGQAYDLAAGSLVAHGITGRPQRADVLAKKLAKSMALPLRVATELVDRGTLVLRQSGCLEDQDVLRLIDWSPTPETPRALVQALEARLAALDRRLGTTGTVRTAALDVVKRVMLVQGMTAARAFVQSEPPDAYLLDSVVNEAMHLANVKSEHRDLLGDAVVQVLRVPNKDVSRELFELAHAAFALETVFLNPAGVDLGTVLTWQLYLDSNIVMRLLHPSCDATRTFEPLFARLRRLRIPLIVLRPFLEEIIGHAEMVENQVIRLDTSGINALLRATPESEQSPLLRWYSYSASKGEPLTFTKFRAVEGLTSVERLARQVARLEIETDLSDAIRTFDNADRETLWHELRDFRRNDQSTSGARRLRRAEATQVMWLRRRRDDGTRAWFLSQDGQLRRALKYIQHGRYATYVTTPTAWMMKLSEVHWGDIDVAGFSELMWVMPLQKPTTRLRLQVAEAVLSKKPNLDGQHPEWLRDQIEHVLEHVEPLIVAELDGDGDSEEATIAKWAAEIVPIAVDKILDELTRSQRGR